MTARAILLIILVLFAGCGAGEARPSKGEIVSYLGSAWFDNEHIIYTKKVTTLRFYYNWLTYDSLSDTDNTAHDTIRTDYYICVTDLEGKEEKILKQFNAIEDIRLSSEKRKKFVVDEGKVMPLENKGFHVPTSYSCSKEWIAFNTARGIVDRIGPIYIMRPDGSQIRRITEEVTRNPRLSPDGKQALYEIVDLKANITSLWLINIDGTEKRKLVEPGSNGVWSPDGKKIAYWVYSYSREDGVNSCCYVIDLDGKNSVILRRGGSPPVDWTPDGKRILAGGFINILSGKDEFFDSLTHQWKEPRNYKVNVSGSSLYKKDKTVRYLMRDYPWFLPESERVERCSLNYARLSPDGKRLVGAPIGDIKTGKIRSADFSIGIGIQDLGNNKELKVLRVNYVMTVR